MQTTRNRVIEELMEIFSKDKNIVVLGLKNIGCLTSGSLLKTIHYNERVLKDLNFLLNLQKQTGQNQMPRVYLKVEKTKNQHLNGNLIISQIQNYQACLNIKICTTLDLYPSKVEREIPTIECVIKKVTCINNDLREELNQNEIFFDTPHFYNVFLEDLKDED